MNCTGTKDWVMSLGGEAAIVHGEAHPFATAVRREKTYAASHGSVKVQEREVERIPLTKVLAEEGCVTFSAKDHRLCV